MSSSVIQLNENDFYNKKIAVISDIHSNAVALKEVMKIISESNVKKVIVLGDLLTYGCHPNEVMSILQDMSNRLPSIYIKGNHDQIYFDHENSKQAFSYKVPDFIKESVSWTINNLKDELQLSFRWREAVVLGPVYIAHANPYEYGNWNYLNSDEECKDAVNELKKNKYQIGIFGHTHRRKTVYITEDDVVNAKETIFDYAKNIKTTMLINSGSVGQPRGDGASFLIFELTQEVIKYEVIDVEVDLSEHLAEIMQSSLSEKTKNKLISYFEEK